MISTFEWDSHEENQYEFLKKYGKELALKF